MNLLTHPRGHLAVHDDDASARTQLLQGLMQHDEVMRHGIVGEAEQHGIERLGRDIGGGVLLRQFDVGPSLLLAQRACLRQHAGREIDAVDPSLRSDCRAQVGKITSGAASDFEHALSGPEPQALDRMGAEMARNE